MEGDQSSFFGSKNKVLHSDSTAFHPTCTVGAERASIEGLSFHLPLAFIIHRLDNRTWTITSRRDNQQLPLPVYSSDIFENDLVPVY